MVTVASKNSQPEEIDAYRKLREEAAPALATTLGERERAIGLPVLTGLQGTLSQNIIEAGKLARRSQLKLSGCMFFR